MPNAVNLEKTDFQIVEWGRASFMSMDRIQDMTRHWALDQWRGMSVRARGGANDCALSEVDGNDAHTLRLSTRLPYTPEDPLDSTYELFTGGVTADRITALESEIRQLKQEANKTNFLLAQIRYGIGQLVGMPLDSVDPDQA